MSLSISQRSQYAPDGRMRWSRALLLPLIPLLAAVLTALLMNWLFQQGWYMVVLMSFAAGGLVGGAMFLAIHWTHCRNPWLAATLGLLTGLTTYLGYYQFGMTAFFGPGVIHRVDLLPWFIQFRMATDVQRDAGRPDDADNPALPSPFMNWFTFAFECLIIASITTEVGRRTALRGYDADKRCWLDRESIQFPLGVRAELESALVSDQVGEFCENHRPTAIQNQSLACAVTLEYTALEDVSPLDRPIYLSAVESPVKSWFKTLFNRSSMLLQKELTPVESLEMQPLFPRFAELLRSRHVELRNEPQTVAGVDSMAAQRTATAVATVTPTTEQNRVHIFGGKQLLMQNLCGLAPILAIAAGGGLIYLAYLLHQHVGLVPAVAVGVVAGFPILAGIYIGLCCPHSAETFYSQAVLRREFGSRAGCLVDSSEPQAFHVVLTLRENWQKLKLETASDAGFAKLDPAARELRMECDAERFQIPLDSIVSCDTEMFMHPIDQNTEYWMNRLVIQVPEGTRELLLCDATPTWGRTTNKMRQARADELRSQMS